MSTQAYAYGGTNPDDVRIKIECRRPAWMAIKQKTVLIR